MHGRTAVRSQAASYGVLSTVSAIFVGDEDLELSDVFFFHVWWDLAYSSCRLCLLVMLILTTTSTIAVRLWRRR